MEEAIERFGEHFGCAPEVAVRSPGRVNLIGEHTDYNGLPVLPFAIGLSHRIVAARGRPGRIEAADLDPRYPAKAIRVGELDRFSPPGEWDNYLRAALLGLADAGLVERRLLERGLRVLVSSDLPAGLGLSSSSALVVGFALAALGVFGVGCDRLRLAEAMAEAEHYVGTRGGGMDQAVCLLGREGQVLKIDFFPLRTEAVVFPAAAAVVLSDSGVRVEKSGAGRALYNRRPIECRLALEVFKAWARGQAVGDFDKARYWGDLLRPPLGLTYDSLIEMIARALDKETYRERELCRLLRMGRSELREKFLAVGPGEYFAEPPDGFKLRRRVLHVVAEGRRVEQAAEALRRSDLERLGRLIAESHASCRDLYEISCPEIEELVEIAAEEGAVASRLTGAGFGGCVLHLVEAAEADRFVGAMRRRLRGTSRRVLRVAPAAGAEVFGLNEGRS